MILKGRVIFTFIIALSSFLSAYGQEKQEGIDSTCLLLGRYPFRWTDLGIGIFQTKEIIGPTFTAGFSVSRGMITQKVRVAGYQEIDLFGFGDSPIESYLSGTYLIGFEISKTFLKGYVVSGPGVLGGHERGDLITSRSGLFSGDTYERNTFFVPKIYLETGFVIAAGVHLGLAASAYCEMAENRRIYGLRSSFVFGKLR